MQLWASEREWTIHSARLPPSARLLLFLRGAELVKQQRDTLDLARSDGLSRGASLELVERSLEPPNGVGWFPEEHGKLDKKHTPHALSPDPLVHETSTLLESGPQCGMMTAEGKLP